MSTPLAAYEAALPDDERVQRKKMFGSPCAFVNRQMFFGTFEDTLLARVGPDRVVELAGGEGMNVFDPSSEKPWPDYIQLDASTPADVLSALAQESLDWAAALPLNMKSPKKKKRRATQA